MDEASKMDESSASQPMTEPEKDTAEIERVIAELARDYTGDFPEEAIRQVQQRPREFIPHLIELLRKMCRNAREGHGRRGNGHLFALYLLTELHATEAWPAIVDALTVPGFDSYDYFGDVITEELPRLLASLAVDHPEVIEQLHQTEEADEYVRAAAATALMYWVRDGRLSREDAIAQLSRWLRQAMDEDDGQTSTFLVSALASYRAPETRGLLEEVFQRQLIDEVHMSWEDCERYLAESEAGFQSELAHLPETRVVDTVKALRDWLDDSWFLDDDEEEDTEVTEAFMHLWTAAKSDVMAELESVVEDEDEDEGPSITVRNVIPRPGRNDPCPCGSGKKYKKCCLKKTQFDELR